LVRHFLLLLPLRVAHELTTYINNINIINAGPALKMVSNVTALVCIGALAYAGERTRARAHRRLSAVVVRCEEAHDKLRDASEAKQKFLANMSHGTQPPLSPCLLCDTSLVWVEVSTSLFGQLATSLLFLSTEFYSASWRDWIDIS
jgi:hypothetical protein